MSASILQNRGRNRFLRWVNKPESDEPLYSSPVRSHRRLKLIEVGRDRTPSSSSIATKFGYVRSLNTTKPVSIAWCSPSTSTSTVLRVPAQVVVGLEKHDVVHPPQPVSGRQSGNTSANHGDLHPQ